MNFVDSKCHEPNVHIAEVSALDAAQARAFALRVLEVDGVEPFGEAFDRGFADVSFGHRHFAAHSEAGELIALGAVADDAIELAVAPACRRRGIGTALLKTIDEAVGQQLPVWAHGNIAGAEQLATQTNRGLIRQLLQMKVGGGALTAAAEGVGKREGFSLLNLAQARQQWGTEAVDRAWLRVNNEAFDWHPEQGGWTLEQLRRGQDTDWFDPEGVLFAVAGGGDGSEQSAEDVVGFHWTRWHSEQGMPTGEVYVIGLADKAQGRGLGAWLTAAGLWFLVKRGARQVLLYVEGDNVAAVKTYERLGFEVSREDVMYGATGV